MKIITIKQYLLLLLILGSSIVANAQLFGGQIIPKKEARFVPNICNPSNPTEIVEVTAVGKTWMDRNLGASRKATSFDDPESYGSLYQYGRASEGHQCVKRYPTDGVTTSPNLLNVLATTAVPGSGSNAWDGAFVWDEGPPYNWLNITDPNPNLWQGVNGVNNPCPSGFRLPDRTELLALANTFAPADRRGAFNSSLKLPSAGFRYWDDDTDAFYIGGPSVLGRYWSSTVLPGPPAVEQVSAHELTFQSSGWWVEWAYRGNGFSVRCVKD